MSDNITRVTGKNYKVQTGTTESGDTTWDQISFQTDELDVVNSDGLSVIGTVTPENMGTTANTIVGAIAELKNFASDGKKNIAAAITKGLIDAAETDTFATLAQKIGYILPTSSKLSDDGKLQLFNAANRQMTYTNTFNRNWNTGYSAGDSAGYNRGYNAGKAASTMHYITSASVVTTSDANLDPSWDYYASVNSVVVVAAGGWGYASAGLSCTAGTQQQTLVMYDGNSNSGSCVLSAIFAPAGSSVHISAHLGFFWAPYGGCGFIAFGC